VCSPAAVEEPQPCAPGERCYIDDEAAVAGFCQVGNCSVDSDCGNNGAFNNICVRAENPPGASGLCFHGCDPLACDPNGGCSPCPAVDLDGDDVPERWGCELLEGPIQLARVGCIIAGDQEGRGACDDGNTACRAGAFCNDAVEPAYCSSWCRLSGGAPDCETEAQECNVAFDGVGFCSRD
jgi:hypothetical protein